MLCYLFWFRLLSYVRRCSSPCLFFFPSLLFKLLTRQCNRTLTDARKTSHRGSRSYNNNIDWRQTNESLWITESQQTDDDCRETALVLVLQPFCETSSPLRVFSSVPYLDTASNRNVQSLALISKSRSLYILTKQRSSSQIQRPELTSAVRDKIPALTVNFVQSGIKKKYWVKCEIKLNMNRMKYWMKDELKITRDPPPPPTHQGELKRGGGEGGEAERWTRLQNIGTRFHCMFVMWDVT